MRFHLFPNFPCTQKPLSETEVQIQHKIFFPLKHTVISHKIQLKAPMFVEPHAEKHVHSGQIPYFIAYCIRIHATASLALTNGFFYCLRMHTNSVRPNTNAGYLIRLTLAHERCITFAYQKNDFLCFYVKVKLKIRIYRMHGALTLPRRHTIEIIALNPIIDHLTVSVRRKL